VPARLGPGYRWLLASSWVTNLGDGVAVAAGPLLVASLTDDPFLVSLAALLRWAPPLVVVVAPVVAASWRCVSRLLYRVPCCWLVAT